MEVALAEFQGRVKAIEKSLDIRERLILVGQDAPANLSPAARALRRTVRQIGLTGMQPSLDGSVLLLAAAFEQFVADVMIEFSAQLSDSISIYRDLPNAIQSANERLTGEALSESASLFSRFDRQRFIDNLRNCQAGKVPYVLNGEAIALNRRNLRSGTLRDLMSRLGVEDIWKSVGATRTLKTWSGPGGARTAQTRAKNMLNELIRNRNMIAHRGGSTTLGPDVVRQYLRFKRVLAQSLVKALEDYAESL